MRSKLYIALIPFLLPGILFGQEVEEEEPAYNLVTDRPRQTESALTVPPVRVQIEAGVENVKQGGSRFWSMPTMLARIGLLSRVELRLRAAYLRNTIGSDPTVDGIGDIRFGTKLQLLGSYEASPKAALIVELAPVIGSEAVSPEGLGGAVILSLANEFSSLTFGANLGAELVEGAPPTGLYSFTYSSGIAGNVGGFLELFGRVSSGEPPQHSFNAGTTILLMRNLQVDLANAFPISDAAPSSLFTVGVSWRLPY